MFTNDITSSNAKHGESIGIGLAASSTSNGPQAKTTEPMDSIKVLFNIKKYFTLNQHLPISLKVIKIKFELIKNVFKFNLRLT